MPPKTPSQEASIIVALMESIDGLRADLRSQNEGINKKLDEQASESKEIVKKIDANAVETRSDLKDIRDDIAEMKVRLGEGSERMRNLRRDVDAITSKCAAQHPITTALQRNTTTDRKEKKSAMPWWLPLLLGGALAFVGEKAARFIINGLADPPQVQAPTPVSPQQPALPGTPAANVNPKQTKQ